MHVRALCQLMSFLNNGMKMHCTAAVMLPFNTGKWISNNISYRMVQYNILGSHRL